MTPAELELFRKVLREETSRHTPPKANGKLKLYLEAGAAAIALVAGACAVAGYLLMPRAEAAVEHQAIRDAVVVERQANLLQEQHLVTLDGNLSEIKEDIKAIGDKVGAKMRRK